MKKILFFAVCTALCGQALHAQITIAAARALPVGSSVTVKGLVINGSELGDIRYMQDATGNIAAFDISMLDAVQRGDSITVSGTTSNYNSLLEISPLSSVVIINSGNPMPAPTDITCLSGWAESYEAKLVTVHDASFTDSGTFSTAGSGTNYNVTDATGTSQVRVLTATNIDGTPIPVVPVDITGIMSQYAPGGTGGYQLLPRDLSDISTGGNPPIISSALSQTNISTSSFTVNFSTINAGNTIVYYGLTTALGSTASDAAMVTDHALNLTGLTAGTIYYVQAASISASNDTSFSAIAAMATASNSSGQIKVWFNNPVDNSVSDGVNAVYVNGTLDDSLIYFMDHAIYSLDVCIYNIDNINGIVSAINDAYARGVTVRVICDSGVDPTTYNSISVGVGNKTKSPPDGSTNADGLFYGINHNKFIVVDAVSDDENDPWVVTGSMNYTDQQIKLDKQNLVAIQDQSLAKGYTMEFNEMFNGDFGPDKSNNTPHEYMIGGRRVESYFSPSDEVETHLISEINTADYDLYFCVFSFTRFSISYAIQDAVEDRGVFAAGIWDQTDAADSTAIEICQDAMGDKFIHYSQANLLHHKYLIVDPNCPQSDPLVWTGSHNWSSSANNRNDENSIVIHDATIANLFYQEFSQRYTDEGATEYVDGDCDFLGVDPVVAAEDGIRVFPNPAHNSLMLEIVEGTVEHMVVYGMNGTRFAVPFNAEENRLDISQLPAGMYMLSFYLNGDARYSSLIKN
ncbi:MAG: phospholipase D-like domain-containing protein [Chitinophagales bacterium]